MRAENVDLVKIQNPSDWNKIILALPNAHILQTWQWGQVKAAYGWQPLPYIWKDNDNNITAAALVLCRSTGLGKGAIRLNVLYIPKGPLLKWEDKSITEQVVSDLEKLAKERKAILIKIDPDVPIGWGIPGNESSWDDLQGIRLKELLIDNGWRFSQDQIQFRNTVLIDLTQTEEQLLSAMKQKTRYNIRLAGKKGVTVRIGSPEDIPMLNDMYAYTAVRDGFIIRSADYYDTLWRTFIKDGLAEPLIAEFSGKPIAAVFIFHFAGISRYLYGMSYDEHREAMPNHLLQWQAMIRSKELECHTYDMWGAPDEFNEQDSLWGVYRFKEGFGGKVLRTLGAWDFPNRPLSYQLYTRVLPEVLHLMRRKGMKETKRRVMS